MKKSNHLTIQKTTTIAVDLMGGDAYPDDRLETIVSLIKSSELMHFKIFASKSYLKTIVHRIPLFDKSKISFVSCNRSVSMDESPFTALRQKRDSSLSMAIKDVSTHHSNVCVTAGNTGAMVALAKHWLNPMFDIEKPVLATLLPSKSKRTLLLDVGATIEARAYELYDFARLGSAWQQAAFGLSKPQVALLNVGTENNKGDDTVRQADAMLKDSNLNYIGFCEGTDLFNGHADVICCNGFVGNITIKSCEAMASYIKNESSDSTKSTIWQKIKKGMRIVEPDKYNGALLLGLDGLIVKSHGNCNAISFESALKQAFNMSQQPIVSKMIKLLENS